MGNRSLALWSWLMLCMIFPLFHFGQTQVRKKILSNGLTAIYVQDTSRPLLDLALSLQAGSRIDGPGTDGVAALWAQTFWNRGADSLRYAQWALNHGLQSSGQHGLSHSQFSLRMRPERLPQAFQLLLSAVEDLIYPGSDLDLALKIYALDLQKMDGDPRIFLERQLAISLWGDEFPEMHRYGTYLDLFHQKPKTYRKLHKTFLHPQTALIVATGPISDSAFFRMADSILGNWTNYSPKPYLPYMSMPHLPKCKYEVYLNENADLPHLTLTWPIPGSHRSQEYVGLAEWFIQLAQSRQGPFFKLLIQGNLANHFNWEYIPSRGPGQLNLKIIPNLDAIPACLEAVQAAFEEMMARKQEWEADRDLAQAKTKMQMARWTDQPQVQLFLYSQKWAIGLNPSLEESVPEFSDMKGFINDFLYLQPHVGGLLLNSRLAARKKWSDFFRPSPIIRQKNIVIPSEPVVALKKDDLIVEKVSEPAIDYSWLQELKIYFMSSSFDPDEASMERLRQIAGAMQKAPLLTLQLNGYADGQGDGVYNYQLSIQRAESVRSILTYQFGVFGKRLLVRGWGEAFAEYEDDTAEHRALNRRVTFDVIKGEVEDVQP